MAVAPSVPTFCLAGAAVLGSVLMHLGETKHGLPGVHPFNRYAGALLWADRATALASTAFVGYRILYGGMPIPWPEAIIGLGSLALSEHVDGGPLWFAATHSLWHVFAYDILARALVSQ